MNAIRKLEIFIDYACPYCLDVYGFLEELLPEFPGIEPVWRLCESHPRPHRHEDNPFSDLCIQAMFLAAESGVNAQAFHRRTFDILHRREADAEDIGSLCEAYADLLGTEQLRHALESGRYRQALEAANCYAFEQSRVWAVPALRLGGASLDAKLKIGLTREDILDFLS
ncbi:MAG: hypothetical protein FWD98_05305 [Defluviitaleaceae bacterium]|nr:hypothetical protein [Defluviitaleaceae bacterium]